MPKPVAVKQRPVMSRFKYWIRERERVRKAKEAEQPKPWTEDPILQSYKFCNVYRECDTVTRWINLNYRSPHKRDKDLWFALAVARFVNWPDTLADLGWPVPWSEERFLDTIEDRMAAGNKVWTGAYVVSTNGVKLPKHEYVAKYVLGTLWDHRESLRPKQGQTLKQYADTLGKHNGFSGFMTGQVIADLKYVAPLNKAADWWSWAASGPGSRRGMNRVFDRELNARWNELEWWHHLQGLNAVVTKDLGIKIHNQDLQNCLCEFDKYERVLWGEGKPRSKYPGV